MLMSNISKHSYEHISVETRHLQQPLKDNWRGESLAKIILPIKLQSNLTVFNLLKGISKRISSELYRAT